MAAERFLPAEGEEFNPEIHLVELPFYCDDGYCVGRLSVALQLLRFLHDEGKAFGFHIQPTKTNIWAPFHPSLTTEMITKNNNNEPIDILEAGLQSADGGITIAGSPLGHDSWILTWILNKMVEQTDPITLLHSAQYMLILLRTIVPALTMYYCRTIPHRLLSQHAVIQEQQMVHLFEFMMQQGVRKQFVNNNSSAAEEQHSTPTPPNLQPLSPDNIFARVEEEPIVTQLTIPTHLGGFNLRTVTDNSDIAYMASMTLCATTNEKCISKSFIQFIDRDNTNNTSVICEDYYDAISRTLSITKDIKQSKELLYQLLDKDIDNEDHQQWMKTISETTGNIKTQLKTKTIRAISVILIDKSTNNKVQNYLSKLFYEAKFEALVTYAKRNRYADNIHFGKTNKDDIRLFALKTLRGSDAFIKALPFSAAFKINNNTNFRTLVMEHIGLPPPAMEYNMPKKCPYCKKEVGASGYHFAVCIKKQIHQTRHNRTLNEYSNALPSGADPQTEIHGSTLGSATNRPIDLSRVLDPGSQQRVAIDLRIVHPFNTEISSKCR